MATLISNACHWQQTAAMAMVKRRARNHDTVSGPTTPPLLQFLQWFYFILPPSFHIDVKYWWQAAIVHLQQPNSDDYCQYLTYKQCWQIDAEHQQWLETNIIQQQPLIILEESAAANDASTHHLTTIVNMTRIQDVVIGYLVDNLPDLLLSILACMNLTTAGSTDRSSTSSSASSSLPSSLGISKKLWGAKVLPAMPSEMERALQPHHYTDSDDKTRNNCSKDVHVTIVLYGLGYKRVIKEAVQRMN